MSLANIFSSVAGQESAELDMPAVVATAEEAAEAVVEAEIKTAEADIAEVEKDIAQQETAIEALEEKVEELEEVIEGTESMLRGDTPFNAGLFAHQFKQGAKIVAKFGAPVEVSGVESYADVSTANLNAYAGIESFKETAGKAIGAIKKFFVDLYNSFINMFSGMFNKLKGLGQKAQVIKSSVLSGGEVKSGVTPPKSAGLLETNGTSKAVDALAKACGSVYGAVNKLGSGAENSAASAIAEVADDFAKAGTKSVEGKSDSTETLAIKVGQGATVKVVSPTKDAGLGSVKVSFSLEGTPAASTASKTDLVSILTNVINGSRTLQNAKLDKTALTRQRDQAIGMMTKLADIADADKKDRKAGAGAIKAAHTAGLKLGAGAVKLGTAILDAQLDFVKAHVGGKAAEKKDEKKEEEKKD
ncbi:internal head protein [Kosakonia phage Kc263]|uniref:Nuclear pore glycoprotein n=1 Tax=Kosakonia phage Kc263 TaxID=2863194 RepID=A0AAE7WF80_9CAUD|nr:internal head protein [Kosakonia phage Kc263]QYN79983.1 nuclear pore glycoprotein [Kosakonia phage Kc263]